MPYLTKIRSRLLLLHLFFKNPNTTGEICRIYSIENLSDMAAKINPLLKKHGLKINNYPPASPPVNSFGEKILVHYWELVTLDG